jgi:hypothetical protein
VHLSSEEAEIETRLEKLAERGINDPLQGAVSKWFFETWNIRTIKIRPETRPCISVA